MERLEKGETKMSPAVGKEKAPSKGHSDKELKGLLNGVRIAYFDGRASWAELKAIADRPSRKDISQKMEEVLTALSIEAHCITEPDLRAGILCIVAAFSHQEGDLDEALHVIYEMSNGDQARAMTVLVSTLAEVGKVDLARKNAGKIDDHYVFWKAHAYLAVGLYSGDEADLRDAKRFAKMVADAHDKEELMQSIRHAREHKKQTRPHFSFRQNLAVLEPMKHLLKSLAHIGGIERTRKTVSGLERAKDRAKALALILEIMAEMIH